MEIRKREKKPAQNILFCTSQVKLIIFDNAQEIRLSTYKENPINDNKGKENKNCTPNYKTLFDKFFAIIHIIIN